MRTDLSFITYVLMFAFAKCECICSKGFRCLPFYYSTHRKALKSVKSNLYCCAPHSLLGALQAPSISSLLASKKRSRRATIASHFCCALKNLERISHHLFVFTKIQIPSNCIKSFRILPRAANCLVKFTLDLVIQSSFKLVQFELGT